MRGHKYTGRETAIVGMACRFPGATTPDAFWKNLKSGVESITPISDIDLVIAGVENDTLNTGNYVRAAARLSDVDKFDASFFDITPREAKAMDPQHRLFLECAWESLEDAGYAATAKQRRTGIVAGSGPNTYFAQNVVSGHDFTKNGMLDSMSGFQAMLGNDKDYLPTRLAYKLGLTGPAINVQTACSTSMVAIHMACRMLQLGECDVVLAGGSTVLVPDGAGYIYQDAMILSSDGHCRPFDANANGTVFGSGVATLTMRRLDDALADGDRIHAVIKGSAINNDGDDKVSFSAPSVKGQADVISLAMQEADVSPETISYLEAHGTGTLLGDPIEVAALSQAFANRPKEAAMIPIGSVKANIGHLIAAAGIASVIKVVMAMKDRTIAPVINFDNPNPEIDFADSPFYVNHQAIDWQSSGPLRAGVSSFGVGGTNAHVILEEAPLAPSSQAEAAAPERPVVLALSARSRSSLTELVARAASAIESSDRSLESMCFTAATGRKAFEHRLAVTGRDRTGIITALRDNPSISSLADPDHEPEIVGLFTGQGSQFTGMGRGLYECESVFRQTIHQCNDVLDSILNNSLISVLYEDPQLADEVHQTSFTQPALFAIEYALYRLWQSRGIQPDTVMGHSVGEYAAACVAGVFSLEDGLRLIAKRGALMQSLPDVGAMLSVTGDLETVSRDLENFENKVSLAAVNGPLGIVVSGEVGAIDELESRYKGQGQMAKRLNVSHAFHSPLMDPILQEFETYAATIPMKKPNLNLVSNVTGRTVGSDVTKATYWAEHIRKPVLFHQGLQSVNASSDTVFLEYGPHPTLTSMGQSALCDLDGGEPSWIASLHRDQDDTDAIATATGALFRAGASIDWKSVFPAERQMIVDFPTYPFQRERHWIDVHGREEPTWHCRTVLEEANLKTSDSAKPEGIWLLFGTIDGLAMRTADQLSSQWSGNAQQVHLVTPSQGSAVDNANVWQCDLLERDNVTALFDRLFQEVEGEIEGIIFVAEELPENAIDVGKCMPTDIFSESLFGLINLVKTAECHASTTNCKVWVISQNGEPTSTFSECNAATAIIGAQLQGLGKVVENEYPDLWGGNIDVAVGAKDAELGFIPSVLLQKSDDRNFVIKDQSLYVPRIVRSDIQNQIDLRLDPEKTYLVTGGLGALGSNVAKLLVECGARKLLLTGRNIESEASKATLEDIRSTGAEIAARSADVSNYQEMSLLLEEVNKSGPTLGGVIHTAGIVDDGMISTMTDPAAMHRVLSPKLDGTLVLDQLTRDLELDFFVCFSSISALLGMKGQAGYVAANCAMNRIVELRNDAGRVGVSIEWGPWSDVGMAANLDPKLRNRLSQFGLFGIDTPSGMNCLKNLIRETGTVTAGPILWRRYASKQYGKVPPILKRVTAPEAEIAANASVDEPNTLATMLAKTDDDKLQPAVLNLLKERVAGLLGKTASDSLPINEPLNRMGFDSLTTIEFRNSLVKLDVKVSLEKLVMGATIDDLASDLTIQVTDQLGNRETLTAPAIKQSAGSAYDKNCVIIPKPNPDAKIRLIGFPYAGGGPLVFQSWVKKLPDFIELGILQLPGRSARLKENFYLRMEDMVDQLVPEILPFVQKPFAFFGHCVGGVQSFEVAQRLRSEYDLEPVHLFVAGGRSPQIYNEEQFAIDVQQFNHETGKAEHELEEEDFVEMLREVNFANNKALFDDKEMRNLMLPIIQSDYEINNYYRYSGHDPLNTPITAIGGRIDPYVTGEHIYGWKDHTTQLFKAQFCAGDHYFMEHQGDLLTGIATRDLAATFSEPIKQNSVHQELETTS